MERSSLGVGLRGAEYGRLVAAHDLLKEKHATALSELEEEEALAARRDAERACGDEQIRARAGALTR